MRKLLSIAVNLGIMCMLPLTAQAVCDKTVATVVRISTFPGETNSFIYYRESALSNRYFYCTTTDAKLIDVASDALGDNRVYIRGSASSCPNQSTGGAGTGSCVWVVPNP